MFFFFENRAACEIKWKNTVQPDRPQITKRRTPISCWITKAADTYTEEVKLTAFRSNNGDTKAPQL